MAASASLAAFAASFLFLFLKADLLETCKDSLYYVQIQSKLANHLRLTFLRFWGASSSSCSLNVDWVPRAPGERSLAGSWLWVHLRIGVLYSNFVNKIFFFKNHQDFQS